MSDNAKTPTWLSRRTTIVAVATVVVLVIGALTYTAVANQDSDGDGLTDFAERSGLQTVDGSTYRTDAHLKDTDGDGLTDAEEVGELTRSADGQAVYRAMSDPTHVDSDEDHLDDRLETRGWRSTDGQTFATDPMMADSDGDGLIDGDEAGNRRNGPNDRATYAVYSDPLTTDSDEDGLSDADEADQSLDPLKPDTDGDGLRDTLEVRHVGTAGNLADTDGDGFDDKFELLDPEQHGLDPLRADSKIDSAVYAFEFATGAFAGEALPGDSVAWLAGNLMAGSLSFVPGAGWVLGGVVDLRDAIASAIRADWVSTGYSIAGIVPAVGDGIAVPLKIARFLTKHPHLVDEVCQLIAKMEWIPESTRISSIASSVPGAWDSLTRSTNASVLLQLVLGGTKLDALADDMARVNHVSGPSAPFMRSTSAAENQLETLVQGDSEGSNRTHVTFATRACETGCTSVARRIDVVADRVGHEAQVGYVTLTPSIANQVRSDAFLVAAGQLDAAHWHFFASSRTNTVGASSDVLSLLGELGIDYTIHLPA